MKYLKKSVSNNPALLLETDKNPFGLEQTDFGENINEGSLVIDNKNSNIFLFDINQNDFYKPIKSSHFIGPIPNDESNGTMVYEKFFIWNAPDTTNTTSNIEIPGITMNDNSKIDMDILITTEKSNIIYRVSVTHKYSVPINPFQIQIDENISNFSIISNERKIEIRKETTIPEPQDIFIKYKYKFINDEF